MAIAVADIIRRAGTVLNDEQNVRWTVPELLDWINDAASEVVIRRPQAHVTQGPVTLVAGPSQTLPVGAILLIDVTRVVPGGAISRVDRNLLDAESPDWYDDPQTDRPRHFCLDIATPVNFLVWPPVKAGTVVEAKYSSAPAKVSASGDILDLDRAYMGPILSYVLYRSLSKDSEYANGAVAVAHFQAFSEALNTSNQVNVAVDQVAGSK